MKPATAMAWRGIVSLLVIACHPTTLLDAPPVGPDAASRILIVTAGDGSAVAYGIDLAAPRYPSFSRPEEIDLFAADFRCPLDVLGMEPGRLPMLDEASARVELPAPIGLAAAHDGAIAVGWREAELSDVEGHLRRIRLPEQNLCRLYGVGLGPATLGFTVGTSTPSMIAPLPDGTALVVNADGDAFSVDFDRNARKLSYITSRTPWLASYEGAGDVMFVVGADGTLGRGEPLSSDFEIVFTGGATIAEKARLSGSPDGSEIFRASSPGSYPDFRGLKPNNGLERFDGTGWSFVTEGGADPAIHGSYDVLWVGPGEAFATGTAPATTITHVRPGIAPADEDVGGLAPDSITDIPGVGLIAGTFDGLIARRTTQWELDPDSDLPGQGGARVLIPTGRGFLYGRTAWASWDPVAGYCVQDTLTPAASRGLALGDRGFLMLTFGLSIREGSSLFTLERSTAYDECLDP